MEEAASAEVEALLLRRTALLEEAASAEAEALLLQRTALLEEAASAEAEALLLQRTKRNCWCLRLGCRRELLSCGLHC